MARCDYCDSFVLFGSGKSEGLSFCSEECQDSRSILSISEQIPSGEVEQYIWDVHQGSCPLCGGSGPVDVYKAYRIWSAILMSSWSTQPQISCSACGLKHQLGTAVFSLVAGWWGIPWGVIMTPVQVLRGIVAIANRPDPSVPSKQLKTMMRIELAAALLERQQTEGQDT
jgi:hypothetical protein